MGLVMVVVVRWVRFRFFREMIGVCGGSASDDDDDDDWVFIFVFCLAASVFVGGENIGAKNKKCFDNLPAHESLYKGVQGVPRVPNTTQQHQVTTDTSTT